MDSPDIVIIGSGMGGATVAAGLAGSGAKVTILEKGERLLDSPETRDARAIFQRGHFRPREMWLDAEGKPFWWPEADTALFQSVRNWIAPNVELVELDTHINDPAFAQACANKLLELMANPARKGGG